jgi:Protein of unknown function (DUF4199)
MLKKILSYGTVSGLLVGVPMTLFALAFAKNGHEPFSHGMLFGYLTMLIALSAIFVAIKRHRDNDLGGVIGFWPAFGLGLGISFVASVFYVVTWEVAVAIMHVDFGSAYANMLIEKQKAQGVSGEALAKFSAEMEAFKIQYANPLFRLPMSFIEIFPVGVLVSLGAAALLRNSRFMPLRRASSIVPG